MLLQMNVGCQGIAKHGRCAKNRREKTYEEENRGQCLQNSSQHETQNQRGKNIQKDVGYLVQARVDLNFTPTRILSSCGKAAAVSSYQKKNKPGRIQPHKSKTKKKNITIYCSKKRVTQIEYWSALELSCSFTYACLELNAKSKTINVCIWILQVLLNYITGKIAPLVQTQSSNLGVPFGHVENRKRIEQLLGWQSAKVRGKELKILV